MNCTIPFPSFRVLLTLSNSTPRIGNRIIRVPHLRAASGLSSNSMSEPATDPTTLTSPVDVLVQYVVLRRDLIDTWPLGSVVTQGCHAAVSAVWSNKDDPFTIDYCSPDKLDSMHKVSLSLITHIFANCVYYMYMMDGNCNAFLSDICSSLL